MILSDSSIFLGLSLLNLFGVLLFTYGFFPIQSHYAGTVSDVKAEDWIKEIKTLLRDEKCDPIIEAALEAETHTKSVIIVIDAWQADFYFKRRKTMPFLSSLESSGIATIFNAHVQSPTVTMPRIKAFTAGNVPSFADVVFNLASSSITDDNIIDRLKSSKRRIVFCGDDTWFRLFPGRFENQSEGTVSFFVNDYTEVDDNVTRCADRELAVKCFSNWDVLLLHYLGLDHIGHSLGGTHPKIDIKLSEMDTIIKKIYLNLKHLHGDRFSIFVLGDHGMTEAGGHGGSSTSETHIPLVIIRNKKNVNELHNISTNLESSAFSTVEQIDLVPTFSFLNRITIPQTSLGVTLIDDILESDSTASHLNVLSSLILNARQIGALSSNEDGEDLEQCIEKSILLFRNFCFRQHLLAEEFVPLVGQCKKTLRSLQKGLLIKSTNINIGFVIIGMGLSGLIFQKELQKVPVIAEVLYTKLEVSTMLAHLFLVLHLGTFFSSSLIEEEHDVQYYFYSTILYVAFLEKLQVTWKKFTIIYRETKNSYLIAAKRYSELCNCKIISHVFLCFLHRLSRAFTEGGRRRWLLEENLQWDSIYSYSYAMRNKTSVIIYRTVADFGEFLYNISTSVDSSYPSDVASLLNYYTKTLVMLNLIVGLLMVAVLCLFVTENRNISIQNPILVLLLGFFVVILKQCKAPNISEPFLWWSILAISGIVVVFYRQPRFAILLWIAFLSRQNLFPLLILYYFAGLCLALLNEIPILVYYALCSSFFYAGNSNSLSTVDVSVGFTGVRSYQPVIIAIQLFLNTYSGPLCIVILWWECMRQKNMKGIRGLQYFVFLTVVARVTMSCTTLVIQRHHLFIWSVFAPKFMYEIAHFVCFLIATLFSYLCKFIISNAS